MKKFLQAFLLCIVSLLAFQGEAQAVSVMQQTSNVFGTPAVENSSYGKIVKVNLGGKVRFLRHSKFLTEAQTKQVAYLQIRTEQNVDRFKAFAYRCPGYYVTRVYNDRYGQNLLGTIKVYVPTSDVPANQDTCNNDVVTPPASATPVAAKPTINISHPNPNAKEVSNMVKTNVTKPVTAGRVTDIDESYSIHESYIPPLPPPPPPEPPILYDIPENWVKPNDTLFRDVEDPLRSACDSAGVGSSLGDVARLYHVDPTTAGVPYQCATAAEIDVCYQVRVLHLNRKGWNIPPDANLYMYFHNLFDDDEANLEKANLDADLKAMLGDFDISVCRDHKVMPDEFSGDGVLVDHIVRDDDDVVLQRGAYVNYTCYNNDEVIDACAALEADPYLIPLSTDPPDSPDPNNPNPSNPKPSCFCEEYGDWGYLCCFFDCPGWDDFLDFMSDDIVGDLSVPSHLDPPEWPVPEIGNIFDTLNAVQERNPAKPSGNNAPELDHAVFDADDIKDAADTIQFRDDDTGGFDITNPLDSLPADGSTAPRPDNKFLPFPQQGSSSNNSGNGTAAFPSTGGNGTAAFPNANNGTAIPPSAGGYAPFPTID